MVSVVHTELAIQISTFHFQITYDSFPCASIRFYALRFDSMRRFHHLFQDEKKSGNFKRSFQTNERLLRSIARSKASIAPFQGQYRTFRAILAQYRTFQGWNVRSSRNGNGRPFLGVRNALQCDPFLKKISGTRS